eukprot:CAMPEP_0174290736 /NCGR_PEP_ID=MMETSP0809-20121228/29944_1 /TAXON_ID=73025 ORGANISM="Eutreptiella gymnastica-like, Strain CCMP1594" /NCGR_SAMPLE_ID=MMETSP0809 /ASSEMBLY_ACC=CAM_ASM_000658 /LENGTH=104 /DNA_ID=CAMNT_0015389623 /DNA_START=543 /DNA_END=854 /DNA_ORIENTATION=-
MCVVGDFHGVDTAAGLDDKPSERHVRRRWMTVDNPKQHFPLTVEEKYIGETLLQGALQCVSELGILRVHQVHCMKGRGLMGLTKPLPRGSVAPHSAGAASHQKL